MLLSLSNCLQRRLLEVIKLGFRDFFLDFFGHPLGLAFIRVVARRLAKRRLHLELLDLRRMPQSFGIISAEILEEALIARRTERRRLCLTLFPDLLLWRFLLCLGFQSLRLECTIPLACGGF